MALKNNTWKLNQWYDQDVAGNVTYSSNIKHLFGWGRNSYGILANNQPGNETHYSSPTQIPGATWKYISMGGNNASSGMATKTDGTLWTWGSNGNGALGQNEAPTTQYSSPVQIPGTNWSDAFHSSSGQGIATKTDGTLWIWGNGNDGYIGQNQPNNSDYSSPVQIPGTNWGTTRGKVGTSTAIKTDGTLWAWGPGSSLANNLSGNPGRRSSPIQIPGTNWSTIQSTAYGNCAVKTDGTLWMWGSQVNMGKFGQNNNVDYSSPIQIPGTWNTTMTGSSFYTTAFIKQNGELWMMGHNEHGYLAQNDTVNRSSPIQVPGTWSEIGIGKEQFMGIKTDGTGWVWGNNQYGQLGLNTTIMYSSPVQLPGDWEQAKGAQFSIFAMQPQ
jgi:alpha-tubulin suppressor-like RCC1 family protein